jgi:hypothetical protein
MNLGQMAPFLLPFSPFFSLFFATRPGEGPSQPPPTSLSYSSCLLADGHKEGEGPEAILP